MSEDTNRRNKIVTVSLLWGAMFFSYMIRYALGMVAPTLIQLYHISPKVMGYILSGWNWSYTGALPLMGPLVDRFGPWIVMSVGGVMWGISTIALPVSAAAASLFAMRFLFGLGHSPMIPANASTIARIFNTKERARATAVTFSGNQVGLAAGATVAAKLLQYFGWQGVFYWIGAASLLWTLAWLFFYPDKRIGRQGIGHRKQGTGNREEVTGAKLHGTAVEAKRSAVPATALEGAPPRVAWISLFRHRSTWGIALGQFGYLYLNYFLVSWLPGYLVLERKMTLLRGGLYAALPFWAGMLGTLGGGWLGDYLIAHKVSTTVSRKSIIGIGMTVSAAMVIGAAFAPKIWMVVTLLCLCSTFLRMATGSANSLPIDLAPRSVVASLTSIQNFFGNAGGLLAPIVTGYIVDATKSFVLSLVVAGGMAVFGAVAYVFVMGNLERREMHALAAAEAG